jgi:hypothetical protein
LSVDDPATLLKNIQKAKNATEFETALKRAGKVGEFDEIINTLKKVNKFDDVFKNIFKNITVL